MENIFENAYFGKTYKTRDGRKAVFYNHHNDYAREKAKYVTMILEGQESIYSWHYDGTAFDSQEHIDIISEWQEETNVDELEFNYAIKDVPKKDEVTVRLIEQAFKAGYYTAKNINEYNMENIFENAYFGKAYKTRNGNKAIFWKSMNSNNTDIALLCEDFCITNIYIFY